MEENKPSGLKESREIKLYFSSNKATCKRPKAVVRIPAENWEEDFDATDLIGIVLPSSSSVGYEGDGVVVHPYKISLMWQERMNQLVDMTIVNKEQKDSTKQFIAQTASDINGSFYARYRNALRSEEIKL